MGIAHGAFCVGCCWSLMLVMFGVGLGSLDRDARPRRHHRRREEPAVGPAAQPPARRRPRPRRRLRGRGVSRRSYASRDVDRPTPSRAPAPSVAIARPPRRARRSSTRPATCLLADGYANLSTRARRRGGRRPAQPDPLPLRLASSSSSWRSSRPRTSASSSASARCSTRPSRSGSAGSCACDFLDDRPRVGLRPDPPGDDRRGLVRRRGRGGGPRAASAAGTACWPTSRAREQRAAGRPRRRSRPAEVAALMGLPFLGAEALILLGVDRGRRCRSGRRCARSGRSSARLDGRRPRSDGDAT